MGLWRLDAAAEDYKRTLALVCASDQEGQCIDTLMANEVRARLAALDIDRGNPVSALQTLEIAVGELRKAQSQSQSRPTKNCLMAQIYLVVD